MNNVNHPKHYNQGKIEVIEFIEDKKLNYHRGNAVKYIARAGIKDSSKEIEDLEKAKWYLDREIELLISRQYSQEPRRPNEMNEPTLTTNLMGISSQKVMTNGDSKKRS